MRPPIVDFRAAPARLDKKTSVAGKTDREGQSMTTYTVSKQFAWQGPLSERAVRVCRMFGLTIDRLTDSAPNHRCRVRIRPGDIVYITGPSGAGKSVLLRELRRCVPAQDAVDLTSVELPDDRTVIDCFENDIVASLQTLSMVGLGDVFSVLNRPSQLSDGQKYRFRLARALAAGRPFVFADEFCSELDRITAATVAFNVHRFAQRANLTLVLASGRDDILIDLAPDVLINKDFTGLAEVIYREQRR
jgi:ABC-type ATPase with predicted acetyltransferase domain